MPQDKAGDISTLFSNPVPDLNWLDVDENVYRELEKLPKQNLDFQPDFEELWTHHEKGPLHFVPNIDPERLGRNQWVKGSSEGGDLIEVVTRHVKDRMMAGWDGAQLAAWVRASVPPEALPVLVPTLRKLAAEQGLLGTLYVDATHWPECDRGQGKEIARKARHAQYVLGNEDKCKGCIRNENGRCSVLKKQITFKVNPDSEMVDEYAAKLKVPKRAFEGEATPADKIKAIFAYTSDTPLPESDLAPMVTEGDQAARGLAVYEPPDTNFTSSADRSLYKDLSQKMMASRGRLSDSVSTRLASADSDAVTALRQEENLLGRVYVRPDQFDNCHKARDFFRRHHITADLSLQMDKCSRCQFYRPDGSTMSCGLLNKQVVTEVPYDKHLLARDLQALQDGGHMDEDVAKTFLARADSESIKALVAEAHTYHHSPVKAAKYTEKYETADMGHYANMSDIQDQATAVPLKHRPVVNATYRALYAGKHGASLKSHLVEKYGRDAVVAAQSHIRPLVRLAGLFGNVVLDPRGFKTAEDAKAYLKKNHMSPKYILAEGCGCGGGAAPKQDDHKRKFPSLVIINLGEIGEIEGEYVRNALDKLQNRKRISPTLASELRSKIGSVGSDVILREAYTAPKLRPASPHRRAQPGTPKASAKKVRRELTAVSNAKDRELNLMVKNVVASALEESQILKGDHDKLQASVGRLPTEKILANLEIARMNALTPDNFMATDVGSQLTQMGTPTEVKTTVSKTQRVSLRTRLVRAMNRGLHTDSLKRWLRNSFDASVLNREAGFIRTALAEQGLLGGHYIDPRPYKTCRDGASDVAKTSALYVREMSKCKGCSHRNANDHCRMYRRDVVAEVPYPEGKVATQERIVTPRQSAPADIGINPVEEYGVMGGMTPIALDEDTTTPELDIDFDDAMGGLDGL